MVRAAGVHKRFGRLEVLRGVTMAVGRGEVVVIIGPSGSGKTTFLRCINHLERVDGGKIYVDGADHRFGHSAHILRPASGGAQTRRLPTIASARERSVSGRSRSEMVRARSSSA